MMIIKSYKLWNGIISSKQNNEQRKCHKYQRSTKYWIYLTNNLVDRQDRSYEIVDNHDTHPHQIWDIGLIGKNLRRGNNKHCTHQNHQHGNHHMGESAHTIAQIFTNDFRQALTTISKRDNTRNKIVHSTHKNTAKCNP